MKFWKTQSFAERASHDPERVDVGYPTDLTAGDLRIKSAGKPTAEAPERETPEGAASGRGWPRALSGIS